MAFFHNNSGKAFRSTEMDYFASGDWKCPDSPTGGHWWNCNVEPHVCKVCGKVKFRRDNA